MTTVNRRSEQLGLLVLLGAFMDELCWKEQREAKMFVPMSKDTLDRKQREGQYGKTRKAMNLAATYLAMAEANNTGLDPKKVESSILAVKNWKFYFIKFMADKINTQLQEQCNANIKLGIKINKPYKCKHKDHKLGKDGASKLADSIFKMVYDGEVRAFLEPSATRYNTREPGAVEFGELMHDEKHMARQFVEVCQGPFYDAREDEHASGFSALDMLNFGSDDEVVDNDLDFKSHVVDYSAQNSEYFDLRREILHAKNSHQRELIVRRAENMAKFDQIPAFRARQLRYWSWQCNMYKERENVQQNASQEVTELSGDEEWISL